MSQNAPFNQNRMQPGVGQPGFPQRPAGFELPLNAPANPYAGMDPRMLQAIQAQLQAPNAGDGFNRSQATRPAAQVNTPDTGDALLRAMTAPGGSNRAFPQGNPQVSMPQALPQTTALQAAMPPELSQIAGLGTPAGAMLPGMSQSAMPAAANPSNNGEDSESLSDLLPGPKDMLIGGAVGIPVGMAIQGMQEKGWYLSAARKLDNMYILGSISKALDSRIGGFEGSWADKLFMRTAYKDTSDEAVKAVRSVVEPENIRTVLKKASDGKGLVADWSVIRQKLSGQGNHAGLVQTIDAELERLHALTPNGLLERRARWKSVNELMRLKAYANRLEKNLVTQEAEARIVQALKKQNVGPVGRGFAKLMNHITRIFGGDTFLESMPGMGKKVAEQSARGGWGKLIGPFIMGALMMGQSFNRAKKAKDGEKVQTFFHDFIGIGIANFIGWEIGRNFLNKFKVFDKLLGGFAKSSPFGLLRRIPLLGKLAGVTMAGFATEMVAMFIIGSIFQKGGEWLSDKIFGKPSEESLNPKKAQTMPPGQGLRDRKVFNQFANAGDGLNPGNGYGTPPASAPLSNTTLSASPQSVSQSKPPSTPLSMNPADISFNPSSMRLPAAESLSLDSPEALQGVNSFLPEAYKLGPGFNIDPYSDKGMMDPFKAQ